MDFPLIVAFACIVLLGLFSIMTAYSVYRLIEGIKDILFKMALIMKEQDKRLTVLEAADKKP